MSLVKVAYGTMWKVRRAYRNKGLIFNGNHDLREVLGEEFRS